jgi:hypothetical protein
MLLQIEHSEKGMEHDMRNKSSIKESIIEPELKGAVATQKLGCWCAPSVH